MHHPLVPACLIPSCLIPSCLLLASCATPTPLAGVDATSRWSANALTTDLQRCWNDLRNAPRDPPAPARCPPASPSRPVADRANVLLTIVFAPGSRRCDPPAAQAAALTQEARSAPWIALRGRAEGVGDSDAQARLGRERVQAVHDYLVQAGVAAPRIHTAWPSRGEPGAPCTGETASAPRGCVEVEIYRLAPQNWGPLTLAP